MKAIEIIGQNRWVDKLVVRPPFVFLFLLLSRAYRFLCLLLSRAYGFLFLLLSRAYGFLFLTDFSKSAGT